MNRRCTHARWWTTTIQSLRGREARFSFDRSSMADAMLPVEVKPVFLPPSFAGRMNERTYAMKTSGRGSVAVQVSGWYMCKDSQGEMNCSKSVSYDGRRTSNCLLMRPAITAKRIWWIQRHSMCTDTSLIKILSCCMSDHRTKGYPQSKVNGRARYMSARGACTRCFKSKLMPTALCRHVRCLPTAPKRRHLNMIAVWTWPTN
jgi:hypothetical protein